VAIDLLDAKPSFYGILPGEYPDSAIRLEHCLPRLDMNDAMGMKDQVTAALRNDEMFLEYLPVVRLEDRCCVGAEALIRWRRGSTVIPPMEFIPQIENTHASGLVTYWVVDTVARELGEWLRTRDHMQISINVPPEVLGRGGLLYAAEKANLLEIAHKFIVEITERGLPDRMGVEAIDSRSFPRAQVALDDVGVSFSASFLLASRLKVNIIKLDKLAVDRLTKQEMRAEMSALSTLVEAAHASVIAEGVETADQAEILWNCGIRMAQGWLFSHPLSAPEFIAYAEAHS
jgi:sensor c-di-GMP phosphodiesterase-like protein